MFFMRMSSDMSATMLALKGEECKGGVLRLRKGEKRLLALQIRLTGWAESDGWVD